MTSSKGLAIVTARGGSKGLPRKNLLEVGGEPLVALAVRCGIECGWCDRVVCSTDDTEIAEVARAAGAEIVMRPADLAGDETPSESVVRHVLESEAVDWPWFVLLQPTSPLRTSVHVASAVEKLSAEVDAVVSVTQPSVHPLKCLLLDDQGAIAPVRHLSDLSAPRQTLPQAWHPNGAIYVCRTDAFRRDGSFFPLPLELFPMDAESSLDVDTEEDLRRARDLVGRRQNG